MKKMKVVLGMVAILASLGLSQPAQASWNLGALVGIASLNNGGGSRLGYGGEVNYQVAEMVSLGVAAVTSSKNLGTVLGLSVSTRTTVFGLQGYYHLPSVDGLRVGALLGAATTSAFGGLASTSKFGFGPSAGYDYMLGGSWSIGGRLDYIFSSGANILQALASIKWHI